MHVLFDKGINYFLIKTSFAPFFLNFFQLFLFRAKKRPICNNAWSQSDKFASLK